MGTMVAESPMPLPTQPTHILLVAEYTDQTKDLVRILERERHKVTLVDRASEGLKHLEKGKFGLAIVDVETSGSEFARAVRRSKRTHDLPLLAMGHQRQIPALSEWLDSGADDYLTYPWHAAVIRTRIVGLTYRVPVQSAPTSHAQELAHDPSPGGEPSPNASTAPPAEAVPDVTMLFADLVGFTKYTRRTKPQQQVVVLNQLFDTFDRLAKKHGVSRLRTIGDGYVAIGGVRGTLDTHPSAVADLALDIVKATKAYESPEGHRFNIRVGVATGPVASGLVGSTRPRWEVWGDTVTLARRMESEGVDGMIQVSRSTWRRVHESHDFTQRDPLHIPGTGLVTTYILEGRIDLEQAPSTEEAVDKAKVRMRLERAEQELQQIHLLDEASGLLTPRGFIAMARQQRQLAIRGRKNVLFMMVRIAHFHVFAMHHEEVAAELILTLGQVFKKTFRDTDVLARLDEDRFICMGIENEPCDLEAWAARFTKAFEDVRTTTARLRVGAFRWKANKRESLQDILEEYSLALPP